MIAIIDYGVGNPGAIANMFCRLGIEATITSDHDAIERAEKLVLPGVGAFDAARDQLDRSGLIPLLERQVHSRKIPLLGICVGMQLLSKGSEEGRLPGLGWLDAETVRFRFEAGQPALKVPHMGWADLEILRPNPLLDAHSPELRFYFVHSYHVRCADTSDVLAVARYGQTFHAAVGRGRVYGTQFHPEKSHKFGLRVLENFAKTA